ncbi:ABC transporter [Pseudothermotoga hypogea DSM 11164 = NBRC 106472]|uniref:ABC transporter n=1 Tax=Pseudothermotoga hypogea DSM 11164 = NBRC 106472 TaxID=1123384 RepID=A0A0X1KT52_9THEM|nr:MULTISPECIES: ABC transporter ATP-binding protein [Pseudothermotoga]AJC74445.1 ABC transporter [Pseudothermotoga hypogea DSM 11164 = NBRC 106472]MBC7121671.1 ABC transporter ATP-binding protein [Pseudothermotoga sp.]MDI6863501.1 ABC transporter ATP-binding protein [Pseudothermotoga sp.]
MANVVIETQNLVKNFGKICAVKDLNLKVFQGEIYGFLGPNGAGKTTTIRLLTGTLKPTSGTVRVLGMDMKQDEIKIKRSIGVVPDEPRMYSNLKGYEFLNFIIEIFGLDKRTMHDRIEELSTAFGVNYLDKYISDMSHGMKQKLLLMSVLMRKPKVIFLDEPTVGLDAKSAKILKLLLTKYASEGCTIFMTTHVLEIAEKMCSRIGIIDKGLLIAEGTMDELRKLVKDNVASLEDVFLRLTATEQDILQIVEEL